LHNDKNIIFCKTDFILSEFNKIKCLDNNVILITGNSDYAIDDNIIVNLPHNVIKMYSQNALSFHNKLRPIPIGLENKIESFRIGHGIGYYDKVLEKEYLISNKLNIKPTKKFYSNFNIYTNISHRKKIKEICINTKHIDYDDANLPLDIFYNKILDYECVVCPVGNGVDTHRLWEVLYLGRIPITIKVGNYKIYELYEKLPIIILDNEMQLVNEFFLIQEMEKIKKINYDNNLLDVNYWINLIKNS
jgi:hypothetical protein